MVVVVKSRHSANDLLHEKLSRLQNDIHKALLNHNQLLCLCFYFKNTKDNQVSSKMPSPLTLMLNFTTPVLSGHDFSLDHGSFALPLFFL